MKLRILKLARATLLATSVIMSITACSDLKQKLGLESVPDKPQGKISVSDEMDAEQLAQAAEQLVGPYTFMLGAKAADMALAKDPENVRAKFYKGLLSRLMVFEGILVRIRPYMREYGDIASLEKTIREIPNSPLKDFLVRKGKKDITDIRGIQDVLVDYRKALNSFRVFLRTNPEVEVTLNLNPHIWESSLRNSAQENCVIRETRGDSGQVVYTAECDYTEFLTRKVNSADALAISQMLAGEIFSITAYTSYGLDGLDKMAKLDPDNKLSAAEKQATLESTPGFGLLRQDQGISDLLNLGSDAVAAYKWAREKQNRLCPTGVSKTNSRRGHLFSSGICVTNTTDSERALAMFEQVLGGIVTLPVEDASGTVVQTRIDYLAWSRKPVQDLRSIMPASYDACNQVTALRDNTIGGIFPDGIPSPLARDHSCPRMN